MIIGNKEIFMAEKKNTYMVNKREDGKWQVKIMGSDKAIKLFATKAEAIEYTKNMAGNTEKGIVVKPSKGANKGKFTKAK